MQERGAHNPYTIQEKANFRMRFMKGESLTDIARDSGTPTLATLRKWYKAEGWENDRNKIEKDINERSFIYNE